MATLNQAHEQWAKRPDDQRFTSLPALQAHCEAAKLSSKAVVVPSKSIVVEPVGPWGGRGLQVHGSNGGNVSPTHWAFSQLCQRAGVPSGYLRDSDMPAALAADNLNWGLQSRDVEDVGVLLRHSNSGGELAAVTGPTYGRIWNADIVKALVQRLGDGVTGAWRVPGIFGKKLDEVSKQDTTLYASDRDLWVFLADEDHRIEIPNRRNGEPGSLARGVFMWNSEVGCSTFGIGTFLFDFVCCNRYVWGAEQYKEIRIRHTSGAPTRLVNEVAPALQSYATSNTHSLVETIKNAQAFRLTAGVEQSERENTVREFLTKRFTRTQAQAVMAVHMVEEGRPIETLWDASVGVTAYARGIPYADQRVEMERKGGELLSGK